MFCIICCKLHVICFLLNVKSSWSFFLLFHVKFWVLNVMVILSSFQVGLGNVHCIWRRRRVLSRILRCLDALLPSLSGARPRSCALCAPLARYNCGQSCCLFSGWLLYPCSLFPLSLSLLAPHPHILFFGSMRILYE